MPPPEVLGPIMKGVAELTQEAKDAGAWVFNGRGGDRMNRPKHSVPAEVWSGFVTRHATGGVIDGVVVSVVPFGAFVDVGEGVHGLLHASSWAARPEPGSRVAVRIQALDVENRRMSLIPA